MIGVEILAMEEVVIDKVFNWLEFWTVLVIAFGVFTVVGILISAKLSDWSNLVIGSVLGMMFGIALGVVFGVGESIPVEYETQYKVIISDEVSMNDFLSKYKIIEQEGRIYTVAERD